MGQFSGTKDPVYITSEKFSASESPVIKVPQDARMHQVAVSPVGAATAGTATITVLPVGMTDELPLFESDGATPVVLTMVGDARSDIIGSLQQITFTVAGFDGTQFKASVTSYF